MREHWITYDPATGEEVSRGSGPVGGGDLQDSEGTRCTVTIPRALVNAPLVDNLDALREAIAARAARRYARRTDGTPAQRLAWLMGVEQRLAQAQGLAALFGIDTTGR